MKFWLLNTFKFLAYISPFLLGFTFITVSALNGDYLKPIIYFGILGLSMLLISQIKLNTNTPIPDNFNELCKTWGWNFFDDAYYRPSLATFFITFSAFYTIMPMIINGTFNVLFIVYLISVFVLDLIFNLSLNKCYTLSSYMISVFTGTIIGGVSSALINSTNQELVYFGESPSNKTSCRKVSNKNFKCLVYKNGELIKRL